MDFGRIRHDFVVQFPTLFDQLLLVLVRLQEPLQRDAWLHHMRAAVEGLHLDPEHEAELWAYLENAANFMVNTFED